MKNLREKKKWLTEIEKKIQFRKKKKIYIST